MAGSHYLDGDWYDLQPFRGDAYGNPTVAHPDAIPAQRLRVTQNTRLSGVRYTINAGAVGAKVRHAIYAASATTGLPTGSPIVDTGELSASALGTFDVSFAATQIAEGWYWCVSVATGSAAHAATPSPFDSRYSPFMVEGDTYRSYSATNIYRTWTYAGSMPTFTGSETWGQQAVTHSSTGWNSRGTTATEPIGHLVFWQTRPLPTGGGIYVGRVVLGANGGIG